MPGNLSKEATSDDVNSCMLFNILEFAKEHAVIDNNATIHLMPSLGHISAIKVVTTVWYQATIRNEIINVFHSIYHENKIFSKREIRIAWGKIEDLVSDKVCELSLPECIRKMLISIVKPIGKSIYEWIKYQDRRIFDVATLSESVAMYFISDIAWTPRGTIDYEKTAKALLLEDGLSDVNKYKIACDYCLEDDIINIAPRVLSREYVKRAFGRSQFHGNYSTYMPFFWTNQIAREKLEQLPLPSFNCINLRVFKFLLCGPETRLLRNPVAVKYMWHMLSDKEKKQNLTFAINHSYNTDLTMFFLSQVREKHRTKVARTCYYAIIRDICSDWLWGDYLLVAIPLMGNVMPDNFSFDLLDFLLVQGVGMSECAINPQVKNMMMGLWKCTPDHWKQRFMEGNQGGRMAYILFSIFSRENADIVKFIMSTINKQQQKEILLSPRGIQGFISFIKSDAWDLLEMIISWTQWSKIDDYNLKKGIVELGGPAICAHFIENNDFEKLEQFLGWCLESKEEQDKLMKELADESNYTGLIGSLLCCCVSERNADFTGVENFLRWLFPSKDEMNAFKMKQSSTHVKKIRPEIIRLIFKKEFEVVDKSLNWCFLNDQEKIKHFKYYLCDEPSKSFLLEVMVVLILYKHTLERLDQFFHWWFPTEEDKSMFVENVLKCKTQTQYLWWKVSGCNLAIDYQKWCCLIIEKYE